MALKVTTGHGLSDNAALRGLVDYGLFGEKMPPCFSSQGLADNIPKRLAMIVHEADEKKLKKRIRASHDYVRYESVRNVNVPRQMGVPHPESYVVQCLALKRHWTLIKRHCGKPVTPISRVYVRRTSSQRVFLMNYQGRQRFANEEADIRSMMGAHYAVNADISNCFPSVYTHSIPWALHGRSKAKGNHSIMMPGNLLDTVTRNVRDGQTNGLLIGPHASNVLSEIILTTVDQELSRAGYSAVRHIDDYVHYAETHVRAEDFIRDLAVQLREYELVLNERKTRVLPMPISIGEDWVRELHTMTLTGSREIRFSAVRSLIDFALNLARREQNSAVLNYAIRMVPRSIDARAKRIFVQLVVNLAMLYPYLASLMDVHVFTKHRHDGIGGMVHEYVERILSIGVKKIYPDVIAHGLYCAIKHGVTFNIAQFEDAIIEIDDCLSLVLLLEYARRKNLSGLEGKVRARADLLKGAEPRDKDRYWPLIYDVWTPQDLRYEGQGFLEEMKRKGVCFLSFS